MVRCFALFLSTNLPMQKCLGYGLFKLNAEKRKKEKYVLCIPAKAAAVTLLGKRSTREEQIRREKNTFA